MEGSGDVTGGAIGRRIVCGGLGGDWERGEEDVNARREGWEGGAGAMEVTG